MYVKTSCLKDRRLEAGAVHGATAVVAAFWSAMTPSARARWARPERIRLSLRDEAERAIALPLTRRRMWPAGIVTGAMFAVFAWIAASQVASLRNGAGDTVSGLVFVLFQGFWVLGWSVGVLILLLLTVLFLFYRESAHMTGRHLVHVPRLGPIRIPLEYDLGKIRDLRIESAGADQASLRFTYGNAEVSLGNPMPRTRAESYRRTIVAAIASHHGGGSIARDADPADPTVPEAAAVPPTSKPDVDRPKVTAPSALALMGANLIPLIGVLVLGWDLGQVMVLFWAENAVIGFYNLLKLAVVAKWATVFLGPFFVGHYGGFMVGHFLFIYYLFVRGFGASGPEPSVGAALGDVFVPLWPALLALFLSHGLSFYSNFLKQREYVGKTAQQQMGEPYKRIVVLHVTIIFGGWAIMLLQTPAAALVLLIVLKVGMDLRAHRREHATPPF